MAQTVIYNIFDNRYKKGNWFLNPFVVAILGTKFFTTCVQSAKITHNSEQHLSHTNLSVLKRYNPFYLLHDVLRLSYLMQSRWQILLEQFGNPVVFLDKDDVKSCKEGMFINSHLSCHEVINLFRFQQGCHGTNIQLQRT